MDVPESKDGERKSKRLEQEKKIWKEVKWTIDPRKKDGTVGYGPQFT